MGCKQLKEKLRSMR